MLPQLAIQAHWLVESLLSARMEGNKAHRRLKASQGHTRLHKCPAPTQLSPQAVVLGIVTSCLLSTSLPLPADA